jgi:hypothetical protein
LRRRTNARGKLESDDDDDDDNDDGEEYAESNKKSTSMQSKKVKKFEFKIKNEKIKNLAKQRVEHRYS